MLEQPKPPAGWNRHHTLYYRRWYQVGNRDLAKWRGNSVMIVPMDIDEHAELHRRVRPIQPTDSNELVKYALETCADIEREDSASYTHLEAFTEVRDELYELYKKHIAEQLGREALRYVKFFDRQLQFMDEMPK